MTMDARWLQAFNDYDHAYRVARKVWGDDAPPEVIQSAAATVLIHYAKLPGASAAASKSNAPTSHAPPSPATEPTAKWTRPEEIDAALVTCPKCGGAMWDNREDKKNPKAPDFKCKSKDCLDDKGYVTAIWVRDLLPKTGRGGPRRAPAMTTGYAQAAARGRESFDEMPGALTEEDNDLPFDRGGAVSRAPAPSHGGSTRSPYAPTEKQLEFFRRLAASPVFSPEEQQRAMDWVNTKATRQTIKDQIDWLKRQVETRTGRVA